mmetsp:Transcript_6798/g.17075  ORF Transcript_6798/g.17075 Transcript_6798/m.17075 type:complete len:84 (+) Transcript_6798:64-315(+)
MSRVTRSSSVRDISRAGRLNITVLAGRNLAVRDKKKGSSDPYCVVRLGTGKSKKRAKSHHPCGEGVSQPRMVGDLSVRTLSRS